MVRGCGVLWICGWGVGWGGVKWLRGCGGLGGGGVIKVGGFVVVFVTLVVGSWLCVFGSV